MRHGSANMDVLVVLGTSSAWIYGIILIFMKISNYERDTEVSESEEENPMAAMHEIHEHVHNFEISASLITVILLGKYLESFSKK